MQLKRNQSRTLKLHLCNTVMSAKCLMPIINPSITSGTYKTDTLVSCESSCCHCCLSSDLEHILNLKAEKIKLTLNGFNSTETIASEEDELVRMKHQMY